MTYKQIQGMHEVRMWALLALGGVATVVKIDQLYPNLKYQIKDTVTKPFKAAADKFSKKEA